MFERRLFFHVDWLLLGAVLLIAAIGAAMIYSTTYVRLPDGTAHAGREFWTQLYALAIGGVALVVCLTIDYRFLAEHGVHSANAASITRHILETYFAKKEGRPLPPPPTTEQMHLDLTDPMARRAPVGGN